MELIIRPNKEGDTKMKVVNVFQSIDFSPEKMKKISLFDTDKLFCDIYCLEPGQFQKVHSHEGSDKVYFVLQGEGKVTIGSEEKSFPRMKLLWHPQGKIMVLSIALMVNW